MYIKLYGALWAWSAFYFKHFNGVLAKCYHGTQHIPEQLVKIADRWAHLRNKAHIFNSPDCDPKVTKYFLGLTADCNIKRIIEHGDNLRVCTPGEDHGLSQFQREIIEDAMNDSVNDKCVVHERFIYKKRVFTTCSYSRAKNRINHFISTADGNLLKMTHLVCVESRRFGEHRYLVLAHELVETGDRLCVYNGFDSIDSSRIVRESSEIVCCDFSSIEDKFICIPMEGGKLCLVPIVNRMETD
ncbi:hypothetical protein QAD02_021823 [Eretmocerus hayati]|uniref:Uncharacterized protein n=1 Tax=Eretmocerus hayati TaxID=131215 RepID=A0ACC2PRK1_9HYME|nr:hypothetical protein QAD02_021823 [Eretmocerus hayati]